MALDDTRVLKAHREAVRTAISTNSHLLSESPDEFFNAVAGAVLCATDKSIRYVVVTSEYNVFGLYATRKAAMKVIEQGRCATRKGVQAMVLPVAPEPRDRKPVVLVDGIDQPELGLEWADPNPRSPIDQDLTHEESERTAS